MHSRHHDARPGATLIYLLLDASGEVLCVGLHGSLVERNRVPCTNLPACLCAERAEGKTARSATSDFTGAEYLRLACGCRIAESITELRLTPDAPAVEEGIGRSIVPRQRKSEDVLSLEKKRTPLGIERLECAEIENCRVSLDLTEIRIDRSGECEIGRESNACIGAAGHRGALTECEAGRARYGFRDNIGCEFHRMRRTTRINSLEITHLRYDAELRRAN